MVAFSVNNGNLTVTNRVNNAGILTVSLNGIVLQGQVVAANIPVVAPQTAGSVYAYPACSSVATGGIVTFKSIVIGTTDQSVAWSVVEAGGGNIGSSGIYTAPSTAGTYHVRATNLAHPDQSTTVTVIVVASTAPMRIVTTVAGAVASTGTTDGTGFEARFSNPGAIATDGTSLYVSDSSNNTIRRIVIATGAVTTIAGTPGVRGSADGTGAAAFFNPQGIVTDGTNLYVADGQNSTIRKIVIATGEVSTIAGSAGVTGSADGTGSAALFNFPAGITLVGDSLYVADWLGNTIRKIVVTTGAVTTLAGSPVVWGSTDGTGSAARFANPLGITTDGTNLFVTDSGSRTIRKVVIATGSVTTIAGSFSGRNACVDGTGAAARFFNPDGIATDGTNLYVADVMNNAIRKIVISSGVVTTVANLSLPTGVTLVGTTLYSSNGSVISKIE